LVLAPEEGPVKPQAQVSRRERIDLIAAEVLEAFRAGRIPQVAAQVLIHRRAEADYPASHWTLRNRILIALQGHYDARGFQQWKAVGRSVRKGERATFILAPRFRKVEAEDNGDEESERELSGFLAVPVFGYIQTEGEPLDFESEEVAAFIDRLPLLEVAKAWGIAVDAVPVEVLDAHGLYRWRQDGSTLVERIFLASENLAIWTHELVHAAHNRLGKLAGRPEEEREAVAQLGATILLEALGYREESDRGSTWQYLQHYAADHAASATLALALRMVEEACECVESILTAADGIVTSSAPPRVSCESQEAGLAG
jgi:hypothetical protein